MLNCTYTTVEKTVQFVARASPGSDVFPLAMIFAHSHAVPLPELRCRKVCAKGSAIRYAFRFS